MNKTQNLICSILEKKREVLCLQLEAFYKNKIIRGYDILEKVNTRLKSLLKSKRLNDKWRRSIVTKLGAYYFDKYDNNEFKYYWDYFDEEIVELKISLQEIKDFPEEFEKLIFSKKTKIGSILSKIDYNFIENDKIIESINTFLDEYQKEITTIVILEKDIDNFNDDELVYIYKNSLIRCGKLLLFFLKQDFAGINFNVLKKVYFDLNIVGLRIYESRKLSYRDLPEFVFPIHFPESPSNLEEYLSEKFELSSEEDLPEPEYVFEEEIENVNHVVTRPHQSHSSFQDSNLEEYIESYDSYLSRTKKVIQHLEQYLMKIGDISVKLSKVEFGQFDKLCDTVDKIIRLKNNQALYPNEYLTENQFKTVIDEKRKIYCKRRWLEAMESIKAHGFTIANMGMCGSVFECMLKDLFIPYKTPLKNQEKKHQGTKEYIKIDFRSFKINTGIKLFKRYVKPSQILRNHLDNLRILRNYIHPDVELEKEGEFDPELAKMAYNSFVYFVEHFPEYQKTLEDKFKKSS